MRIAIIYPPITYNNEYPLLTQNRQFKYTNSRKVRIYPLVIAYLATMLKNDNNEVLYLDGINLRLSMKNFEKRLTSFKPDFTILETKAPIIKKHWQYINELKKKINTKIILVGDHIIFYPEESLLKSEADYTIAGGDYDFIIRDLIRYYKNETDKMPSGVYYKKDGEIKNSGIAKFYNLNELPIIDRDLTQWNIYGEAYLYHPVAYILSGRGCGGSNSFKNFKSNKKEFKKYETKMAGLCTFCIWQYSLWKCSARLMSPSKVVDEIENLIKNYKIKEIFDENESGAIWSYEWLKDFYEEMKKRNLLGKITISSNARADSLNDKTLKLLKKLNYRLLKIGVESGNNKTLKLLKKDETIEEIVEGIKRAKRYGLIAMLTTMVGYPWENEEDTKRTYKVTKEIMLYKTHFGDSLQASIIIPYPGTPLYREAIKNKWLIVKPDDYEKFDMAHQILKTDIDTEKWCKKIWKIHLHPLFLLKSFLSIRKLSDIKLAIGGLISLFGHLKDYKE